MFFLEFSFTFYWFREKKIEASKKNYNAIEKLFIKILHIIFLSG
jgi:hypothetical protein